MVLLETTSCCPVSTKDLIQNRCLSYGRIKMTKRYWPSSITVQTTAPSTRCSKAEWKVSLMSTRTEISPSSWRTFRSLTMEPMSAIFQIRFLPKSSSVSQVCRTVKFLRYIYIYIKRHQYLASWICWSCYDSCSLLQHICLVILSW